MLEIITTSTNNTLEFLQTYWNIGIENIWIFLNSKFGTAAIGSFFGAVGGYVIVAIINRRKEILSNAKGIKIATSVCHSLFNTSLGLYKQHIKELCEKYETDKKKFITTKTNPPKTPTEILIVYDYRSIIMPNIDFSLINSKLFEKTELHGRSFALATSMINSFIALKDMLDARHQTINNISVLASRYTLAEHDRACLYFGHKFKHPALGTVKDENYPSIMKALKSYNEDCTWFSKELTQELLDLEKINAKKVLFFRPKTGSVDYSDIDGSLMPDDNNYKDWREKFKKA